MWLLMRAPEGGTRPRELASCPDTRGVETAEAWQWSMRLDDEGGVDVTTDPMLVQAETRTHTGDLPITLTRPAGWIVGLIPTAGDWTVEVSGGPWRRVLHPGDLLLVEDDRGEALEIIPSNGAGTAIQVVVLRPADPAASLRWIP